MYAFGQKLKLLRKQHQLTQAAMGERLSMEQSTYCKYENNRITPTLHILDRVVNEFQVSHEWLTQTEDAATYFHDCSIGNFVGSGATVSEQNHYTVPKEVIDNLLTQQKQIIHLLEKLGSNSIERNKL